MPHLCRASKQDCVIFSAKVHDNNRLFRHTQEPTTTTRIPAAAKTTHHRPALSTWSILFRLFKSCGFLPDHLYTLFKYTTFGDIFAHNRTACNNSHHQAIILGIEQRWLLLISLSTIWRSIYRAISWLVTAYSCYGTDTHITKSPPIQNADLSQQLLQMGWRIICE